MSRDTTAPGRRSTLLLAVLSLGSLAYALPQSLVVPALPELQRSLHTSTTGATWIFTSYLLSASVVTPIAGRLGDLHGKRRALVATLLGLAFGTLLAGLATSLPLMLLGRTLQGCGGAIFPLAFGILRDELEPERIGGAIALISGILGIGGGLGIVLAGPLLDHLSYHWLFWIPLAVVAVAIAFTLVVIPASDRRAEGRSNWVSAFLLSVWLVGLLLALSEAPDWGWGSARAVGLFALAGVVVPVWVWAEQRAVHPLVDMGMMRLTGVWTTNLVAFLLGVGMYTSFVLLPQLGQLPKSTGYGFGASVTGAGLLLLPLTVTMLVFSLLGGRLSALGGSKRPLLIGALVITAAYTAMTLAHGQLWEIYISSGLLGIGMGLAFAALSNLVVQAVRPDQTGVATGMNTIVRLIGGAVGSQVAATLLAEHRLADGLPKEHGYTLSFAMCAAAIALATLATLAVPGGRRSEPQPTGEIVFETGS